MPDRTIVRVTQSPMNARIWCVDLDCGHEVWLTQRQRPALVIKGRRREAGPTWAAGDVCVSPRRLRCPKCGGETHDDA